MSEEMRQTCQKLYNDYIKLRDNARPVGEEEADTEDSLDDRTVVNLDSLESDLELSGLRKELLDNCHEYLTEEQLKELEEIA